MGTLINKNQLDSGVYTNDNLVAGNGIEIVSTISKYIVSNMTRYNYISLTDTIAFGNNPFSIVTHIKTGSSYGYGAFLSPVNNSYPMVELGITNAGKIRFQESSNSETAIFSLDSNTVLSLNTEYWIKAEFDGAKYNIYIGQTKEDLNGSPSDTYTGQGGTITSNSYALGSYRTWVQQQTFNGSIWISDTKIISNGIVVFDGNNQTQYSAVGTPTITKVSDSSSNMKSINSTGANDSLSNLSNAGKIAIAHNATISNIYDDITVPASGTELTAPADGYFYALSVFTSTGSYLEFYDTTVNSTEGTSIRLTCSNTVKTTPATSSNIFQAYKGQKVTLIYNSYVDFNYTGYSNLGIKFFYDIGAESEQGE